MRTMLPPLTRKPDSRQALPCVRCSTRVATRTLPAERSSNSVTGRRSRVGPVETEVADGRYLVVTDRVLHRLLHRDPDYRTDVHVGFPVRAVGANSKTRASCLVGRVLTQKDSCADRAPPLFETERHAASQQFEQESGPGRALFFRPVQTHCQQQRRSSSNIAWLGQRGRDAMIYPVLAEPT